MGSLEKLCESIAVVGHKKDAIENLMRQIMSEVEVMGKNSTAIRDVSARAVSEVESKQKQSREVVKSVQASYALLNSKKRWLEEGLKKLDENVKFVGGALQKVEEGKVQSRVVRDFIDQQLKELAVKEKQIQELSEGVRLTLRDVGEKKNEVALMEEALYRRRDEMESRQKQVEARELAICDEQETLKKMKKEMDAEKKRLECELESRKVSLVERENLVASKEKTFLERESEFALKQKLLESDLESRNASLLEKERLIISKQLDVESRDKFLGTRENLMQSNAMRDSRENTILQPDSCTKTKSTRGICMGENKRGFGDGSVGDVLVKNSLRRDSKRKRSGDGLTEQHIKACPHPESGSKDKLQTKISEEVVAVDSDSDSEVKDTQKRELVGRFNVGETWACFDAKDRMPRTYVKILGVTEMGGNLRVQVEWMKPCSKLEGEREWISAGLPVGCGAFEPLRKSFECPRILYQPVFSAGNPCIIVPFVGEIWAIYKDWNIKTWSSCPDIHKQCEYEIVEILPYPEGGSSAVAVKVAYLDKVRGSICSFQRRSKQEEDAITVEHNSLYRFSHKVPSSKSSGNDPNVPAGVFELDRNALPPGL